MIFDKGINNATFHSNINKSWEFFNDATNVAVLSKKHNSTKIPVLQHFETKIKDLYNSLNLLNNKKVFLRKKLKL